MRQQALLPSAADVASPGVPGLVVHRDYIDEVEERRLLADIEAGEWTTDFRRGIQLFGLGYGDGGTR